MGDDGGMDGGFAADSPAALLKSLKKIDSSAVFSSQDARMTEFFAKMCAERTIGPRPHPTNPNIRPSVARGVRTGGIKSGRRPATSPGKRQNSADLSKSQSGSALDEPQPSIGAPPYSSLDLRNGFSFGRLPVFKMKAAKKIYPKMVGELENKRQHLTWREEELEIRIRRSVDQAPAFRPARFGGERSRFEAPIRVKGIIYESEYDQQFLNTNQTEKPPTFPLWPQHYPRDTHWVDRLSRTPTQTALIRQEKRVDDQHRRTLGLPLLSET